jgi:hypothetical protein
MYSHYVSLGDSQTDGDHYALADARDRGVLRGRSGHGLGSGSLLWQNDDRVWPEFRGRDLRTRYPGARYLPLALDGAVIPSVRNWQLPRAARAVADRPVIVTLTVGGNDALHALGAGGVGRLASAIEEIAQDYVQLVSEIRARLPRALLVLNTVYDPTDGTGVLRGADDLGRLPIHLLDRFNDVVRSVAARTDGAVLADIHRRFLGHGIREDFAEGWYWRGSVIEPGFRGASEIRRLWLEVIDAAV